MNEARLNGLDLFSGYGGLSLALCPYVRALAYCEINRYAQSILLSRIEEADLERGPIWDDIRSFDGKPWHGLVDIIYAGFPCQGFSVAGTGAGLADERSGLFFELLRVIDEIAPIFVFLENVPAIRSRGLDRVLKELTRHGFDSRWTNLSAEEVGAPHKRNRFFLLAANADRIELWKQQQWLPERSQDRISNEGEAIARIDSQKEPLADTDIERLEERQSGKGRECQTPFRRGWWASEPRVCRVAYGCEHRVDRIKALGNGVVPLQARKAFERLIGLSNAEESA